MAASQDGTTKAHPRIGEDGRVSEETSRLVEHGNDTIPVKVIDLLSVVARLEQADREGKIERDGSAAERLVTCDLPRLKRYLPDEAHRELSHPWGESQATGQQE